MRRSLQSLLLALALAWGAAPVYALPPAAAALAASTAEAARWVQHQVIPGERLAEIAERYDVAVGKILQWNALEAARPLLRVGQKLRIWTAAPTKERAKQHYTVREGDSWTKIARRFDVDATRLRRDWNPQRDELAPGDQLVLWVDREVTPVAASSTPATITPATSTPASRTTANSTTANSMPASSASASSASMTAFLASVVTPGAQHPAPRPTPLPGLVPLPAGHAGLSVGTPTRGRLVSGVQLPAQPEIYTIRTPEQTYGSSHAVATLQKALADFRHSTGFDREILVCDMSRQGGGRFRPHRSHTSGRDVDIQLPLRRGVAAGTIPRAAGQVDWDVAWKLVRSLVDTGEVRYVFLARQRQRPLYEAARRAGETPENLEALIQFPRRSLAAVVRHSAGHIKHIHVRFRCAPEETQCVDP